jgi:hypothetical protein
MKGETRREALHLKAMSRDHPCHAPELVEIILVGNKRLAPSSEEKQGKCSDRPHDPEEPVANVWVRCKCAAAK